VVTRPAADLKRYSLLRARPAGSPETTHVVHVPVQPGQEVAALAALLAGPLGHVLTGEACAGDSWDEWAEPAVPGRPVALHADLVAADDEQAVDVAEHAAHVLDVDACELTTGTWSENIASVSGPPGRWRYVYEHAGEVWTYVSAGKVGAPAACSYSGTLFAAFRTRDPETDADVCLGAVDPQGPRPQQEETP